MDVGGPVRGLHCRGAENGCDPQPASLLAQFLLNRWEDTLLRMRVEKNDAPLKQFTDVVFDSLLV
jgi:TetR/AcrR family transcriptional repressor of nem operon